MPLLSVILPTFNSELYVAQAISSVLRQTFCDFELIIVDDHSTDLTPKIIGSFTDDRIQILRHDRNDGLVKSLNDGVALASGEYIARMDHDDIADPRRFETQIDYLKQHPDVGVLGTGIQIMNGQGELGLAYEFPLAHSQIEWAMAFFCPIAHPTVIMRAAIFNEVGGYSQEASYAEDYDLWERLIRLTKFANIPGQFLHLRKHEQNMT